MGVLVVTVLRAKQLSIKDISGSSDPFVKLKLADSTKQTKVIKKNLNPEWNETFSLAVNDAKTDSLEISVYDWDKFGENDKLGVQVVPLKQLSPNSQQTLTLNLLKNYNQNDPKNEKDRGQIILELEYKRLDGNEKEDEGLPKELTQSGMPSTLDHTSESLEDAKDAEPTTVADEQNQDDNVANAILPTESAEDPSPVENREVETTTAPIEVGKEDAGEGEALAPESDGAISVEPTTENVDVAENDVAENDVVENDQPNNEEKLGGEDASTTDSANAIHAVEDKNIEAPTLPEELAKGETADDVTQSPEIGEANVESLAGDEEVDDDAHLTEETPLSTDSAEAILFEGENVEAPTSRDEHAREVTSGDESNAGPEPGETTSVQDAKGEGLIDVEGAVNTDMSSTPAIEDKHLDASTPEEELAKEETAHGATQSPESGTAPLGEDAKVGEVTASDEGANKRENVADEKLLATDSSDAIPAVKGRDFEAPTSHEELATDDTVPDESSLAIEAGEATSTLEDDAIEASAPKAELPKEEETTDEIVGAPESVEAISSEDAKETERVTSDEDVKNGRSVAEEASLTTNSAEAIPSVGDKDVETPVTVEEEGIEDKVMEPAVVEDELLKENVAEEAQSNEESHQVAPSVEDAQSLSAAEDEKDVMSGLESEDRTKDEGSADELPAEANSLDHEDTVSNDLAPGPESVESTLLDNAEVGNHDGDSESVAPFEDIKPDELASTPEPTQETPIENAETGSAETVKHDEDSDLPAPGEEVQPEELALAPEVTLPNGETLNHHEKEPVIDERVESADSVPVAKDEDVDAPPTHEALPIEETADAGAQLEESGETPLIESAKEEPLTPDEDLNQERSIPHESEFTTDSAETIPAAEQNVEAATSHEEHAKEDTTDGAAQPEESREAPFLESAEEETLTVEEDPKEVVSIPEELAADPAETIPSAEEENVEAPASHEELCKEDTSDGAAQPEEYSEAPLMEPVKDEEPLTVEEDPKEVVSIPEELELATDSAESIPATEKENVEAPASYEELAKEETAHGAAEPEESSEDPLMESAKEEEPLTVEEDPKEVSIPEELELTPDSAESIPATEEENVESPTSHEELAKEETADGAAEPEDSSEGSLMESAKEEEPLTVEEDSKEVVSIPEELELTSDSPESIPAVEEENVESPTSHEELAKEETADGSSEPEESSEGPLLASAKEEEPLTVEEEPKELELTIDSTESIPATEDIVEAPTSHEEFPKEETANEVAQPEESSEGPRTESAEEELLTVEEDPKEVVSIPEELELITESAESIPSAEEENVETPTSHEELVKEGTGERAADPEESSEGLLMESAKEEEPLSLEEEPKEVTEELELTTDSAESVPANEEESVEAPTSQEEFPKEETADGAAQPEESSEGPLMESAKEEERLTVEEVSVPEELELTTDSADIIPAAEEENVDPPTAHEELAKEETADGVAKLAESSEAPLLESAKEEEARSVDGHLNKELSIEEEGDFTAVAPETNPATEENVELPPSHEEVANEETANGAAQSVESSGAPLLESAKEEESLTAENDLHKELRIAEKEDLSTHSADTIPATAEENVEPLTLNEQLDREETAEGAAESEESREVPLVESAKEEEPVTADEDPNKELRSTEDVDLITNAAETIPPSEESLERLTSHEELDIEETAEGVAQPEESSEAPLTESAKEEEPLTADEDAKKELSIAEEVDLTTHSAETIPVTEEENVEVPTSHGEPAREETAEGAAQAEESNEATLMKSANEEQALTVDEDVNKELSIPEEVASRTDSAETTIPAAEEKNVEASTSHEELVGEETTSDASQSPESVESTNVTAAVEGKDVEARKPQEDLGQEEKVTDNLAGAIPAGEANGAEPATAYEDVKIEQSTAEEQASTTESPEMTHAVEDRVVKAPKPVEEVAEDTVEKESALVPESSGVSPIVEDADVEYVLPAIENKDIELPTSHHQLAPEDTVTRELPVAPEFSVVTPFEVDPVTVKEESKEETSLAGGVSSTTASTEPVGVGEAKDEVFPTPSEEPNGVNLVTEAAADAVLPQENNMLREISSARASTGGTLPIEDKDVESRGQVQATKELTVVDEVPLDIEPAQATEAENHVEPATASKELLNSEASPNEQLSKEEPVAMSTDSATEPAEMAEMVAKTARDPGFLQERQEKVQNVADDYEDDKATVPLSTHTADLSSSWVSVSPIQYVEAQSASAGSHLNLSQTFQSGRPDDDLASGGDGWRIVSDQDISALGGPKSKTRDVDTGSSGTTFPFSIVLWCSQSMATLFGGPRK